jgi:elongation factor G
MQKRQHIELELEIPKIAYKETIVGRGEGHHRHKKQSGGRGQFGEVYLRVEPMPPEDEDWFVNKIVGGAIPSNFIPAVQKGLVEGMQSGPQAGYPLQGVRVELYDGSFHAVDSSEVAFKIAGARALRAATAAAKPALLEPIMEVAITIPEQFMGDVSGDLSHKRGRIQGMVAEGGMQVITAEVPKAELSRYSSELRSITGGRGTFEMRFVRYDTVPGNVAQAVIQQVEQEKVEESH